MISLDALVGVRPIKTWIKAMVLSATQKDDLILISS